MAQIHPALESGTDSFEVFWASVADVCSRCPPSSEIEVFYGGVPELNAPAVVRTEPRGGDVRLTTAKQRLGGAFAERVRRGNEAGQRERAPGTGPRLSVDLEIVEVAVEEVTLDSFSPFGTLIFSGRSATDFDNQRNPMLDLGLAIDGAPALFVIRYLAQDMTFSMFERHLTMTESRIALGNAAVMVVAGPPLVEPNDRPDPKRIRAFLLRPGVGFMLWRGTWHALSCFPVASEFADFAFLSEREAEEELRAVKLKLKRTDLVDLTDSGKLVRVVDPAELLS